MILRCTSDDVGFRALVAELDAELWRRYGELQASFAPHNVIDTLATVVVARDGEQAIGCACFKPCGPESPERVELKRVYVAPEARGRGLAAQLIRELELWARELGFTTMLLETGPNQPEAIALYAKLGFTRVAPFGPYADLPASICMSKRL